MQCLYKTNGIELDFKISCRAKAASLATVAGHERVAELLINKGADVNSEDRNGWTPLSAVAHSQNAREVELLLTIPGVVPFSRRGAGLTSRRLCTAFIVQLVTNSTSIQLLITALFPVLFRSL